MVEMLLFESKYEFLWTTNSGRKLPFVSTSSSPLEWNLSLRSLAIPFLDNKSIENFTSDVIIELINSNSFNPSKTLKPLKNILDLKEKKNINLLSTIKLETPLHVAIRKKNYLNVVQLLIQYGAKTNIPDGFKKLIPLHLACIEGNSSYIPVLLNNCHDTYLTISASCKIALHYAIESGDINTVKILINDKNIAQDALKIAINMVDMDGHTPLHLAVIEGFIECMDIIITKGGDINICDNDGRNVVDLAREMGNSRNKIALFLENSPSYIKRCSKLIYNNTINTQKLNQISNINDTVIVDNDIIEYWVVLREGYLLEDHLNRVIVHNSKIKAAKWANLNRGWQANMTFDSTKRIFFSSFQNLRKNKKKKEEKLKKNKNEKDDKIYNKQKGNKNLSIAKIHYSKIDNFIKDVAFVQASSSDTNDYDDDPNWRKYKDEEFNKKIVNNVITTESDLLKNEIKLIKEEIELLINNNNINNNNNSISLSVGDFSLFLEKGVS
jgi:ankyrin repeat protein